MPSIKEQVSVVVAYIAHRKNVEVELNIEYISRDAIQQMMLNSAYNDALNWFTNNGGTVNLI